MEGLGVIFLSWQALLNQNLPKFITIHNIYISLRFRVERANNLLSFNDNKLTQVLWE